MHSLIIILIFLYILLIVFLCKRSLEWRFLILKKELEFLKQSCEGLIIKEKDVLSEKSKLEGETAKIFALYEITKDISSAINEGEALNIFKDKVRQYLKFEDCKLLDRHFDAGLSKDYFILELHAERKIIGNLAIRGIPEEDKEKFNILAQQFALGLRRVRLYEKIEELAITDSLTHIFTRRYALERLEEEFSRALKYKLSLSLLMIDVDNFKTFNDKYGHLVGDVILKEIALVIKSNIREIDLLGRFGGEEFICILPETDEQGANFAAERIRSSVQEKEIKAYDELLKATISVGIATFPKNASKPTELIDKSDWALYRAKNMGRNRVCCFAKFKPTT
ncbi:MAG: GGDEF domain-containing protein [Candidatus Omnitrophota bacterium]|nr:GGDEF domain-containing protein [Candidatus Omnitrophota bacterium]